MKLILSKKEIRQLIEQKYQCSPDDIIEIRNNTGPACLKDVYVTLVRAVTAGKISTIKKVRALYGLGLKESKLFVDEIFIRDDNICNFDAFTVLFKKHFPHIVRELNLKEFLDEKEDILIL